MIYKAQLLIAECKTGWDAFGPQTFQTLESIANALGRGFVPKILVTSLAIPEENKDDILSRTKSSDISIISRDDIPNLANKLAEEAKKHIGR
jgi:hypothetical protein